MSSVNACSSPSRARCSVACSTYSACHPGRLSRHRSVHLDCGVVTGSAAYRTETRPRKDVIMNQPADSALRTALAYYQAWTSHDLDQAMSYIADDIVCDAPPGRLEGADAYRGFLGPFVQIVTGATMIAAFGDDETALVMYDTQTVPVKSAPGPECVTVRDGKITYSRLV